MARYIDAEKCPCNGCGVMYCYKNCKEYDEWFNGCDYDVEAKVAELEKERSVAYHESHRCFRECSLDFIKSNAYHRGIAKAISIVRGKE